MKQSAFFLSIRSQRSYINVARSCHFFLSHVSKGTTQTLCLTTDLPPQHLWNLNQHFSILVPMPFQTAWFSVAGAGLCTVGCLPTSLDANDTLPFPMQTCDKMSPDSTKCPILHKIVPGWKPLIYLGRYFLSFIWKNFSFFVNSASVII